MRFARIAAAAICAAGLLGAAESARLPETVAWQGPEVNGLGGPSPDGRLISYVDWKTGDLAVRDWKTGASRHLTHNRAGSGEFAYFSVFARDGESIAYAWSNEEGFYDLRLVSADGVGGRILYRNPEAGFVQPCAFTPDGREVLTLFFRKDNISQIALVSVETGAVRVLKSLNWVYPKRMDISPDGRYIVYDAFSRSEPRNRDLYLLTVDGSRETVLLDNPASDLFPLWAPDGRSVYFASDRSGVMSEWRLAVENGQAAGAPELVHENLGRCLPLAITQAGDLFYAVREGAEDIWVAPVQGGAAHRFAMRLPGRNTAPAFSPDGLWLACLSRQGTENFGQDSRGILLRSLKTGEERDVRVRMAFLEKLWWSPDSRWLLIAGGDGKGRTGLFRVEIETGRFQPVAAEPGGAPHGFEGAWSPDGQAVYYAKAARLYRRELDKDEESMILAETGEIGPLTVAGGRLVYALGPRLRAVGLAGGKPRDLAALPAGEPLRSLAGYPGGLIAGRAGELWSAPADGKPATRLAIDAPHQGDVTVSPDGDALAFTVGRIRMEIRTIRLARGDTHQ